MAHVLHLGDLKRLAYQIYAVVSVNSFTHTLLRFATVECVDTTGKRVTVEPGEMAGEGEKRAAIR